MIEINKKQDCCGCTACEAICPKDAIVMKEDNEGFLYPTVDKSRCVECNACNMVCPIQSPVTEEEKPQKAYLVQHSDEKVRLDSSAGGAFTAIATVVLQKGGVVFGAAYDENFHVQHTQMRIYALGALEIFDPLYDIDTVQMTIYQPRKANISVDSISRNELYDWAEHVLKPAALEADEGNGEFHAGHWCRFCKARHICRERAKKNLELAAYEFAAPPLLSDEEIVEILEKVDSLLRWANDVKEYALQEAVAGKKWDGYKLVEGRSIRKYTSEKSVAEAAAAAGYDPYEKRVLGVTEMQKMMGKKKFEEILGAMVIKPQGKPVLVSRDDKRPEMNTINDDFKEEN